MSGRFLGAVVLVFVVAGVFGGTARPDEPPDPPRGEAPEKPGKPTTFGAEPAGGTLPVVAPGDVEGLLRNCDIQRSRAEEGKKLCELDKANMPFLTAAYLALWAILMAFFAIVALRQKRMHAEMAVLRERLARLGDDAR
jgi:hypothetical protein